MVREAYYQLFRNDRKEDKQSYLEFSRDLLNNFSRWTFLSEKGHVKLTALV